MKEQNNRYMSSYNVEKFKEILDFLKLENKITKPWNYTVISLFAFVLFIIVIRNELLLIVCCGSVFVFIALGCFFVHYFKNLKEKKYENDILKIQNEIFSKILIDCDAKISLKEGLSEDIIDYMNENSEDNNCFFSDEGFVSFIYKDTLVSRGLVDDYDGSRNGKKSIYMTCYVFKPNDEDFFSFKLGNDFTGKDCIPIDNISSKKKFNIIGESDKISSFLTKEKIEELSKLNKLMNCNFNIKHYQGLVIMSVYHGFTHPENLDITYNDTIESYELKLENEVEKMKCLVDFIND